MVVDNFQGVEGNLKNDQRKNRKPWESSKFFQDVSGNLKMGVKKIG